MNDCDHRTRMFVPSEDDPELMADLCLKCHKVLGFSGPDDPELAEIGDGLGDPDPEE